MPQPIAVRDEIHEPTSGPEAEIIDRFLAPARDRLNGARWETAWQGMTFEQAVSHALAGLKDR